MKILAVLISVLLTIYGQAQTTDSVRLLTDEVLKIMRENALHKSRINWQKVTQEFHTTTKDIKSIDSLLKTFPVLFKAINDFHGGIQTKDKFISWTEGKRVADENKALDSAYKFAPKLSVQRFNDIGYFRLPGGVTKNVPYVTQMLIDSLCTVDPSTAKGWIIDLRLNSGGNVWFMFSALSSFLGEGKIGGVRYTDNRSETFTHIENGVVFGNNNSYSVPVKRCVLPNAEIPVVVLISSKTASSAEAVALAFRGRANTLIIGEPSAGLVTSNNSYPLRSDLTLVLAAGYMTDRKGQAYTESIQPDLLIKGGDNFAELLNDLKIRKSLEWLKERRK